jgi:hypothetical protein
MDAMLISNPYYGKNNTRISEMALHYRIGTETLFTSLFATASISNVTKQLDLTNSLRH